MSPFETLLAELGVLIGEKLSPDTNGSCLLHWEPECDIYLEPDREVDALLVAMMFPFIAPGPGRGRFFQAALMANHRAPPLEGIFAYSRKADCLTLFERLPWEPLSGRELGHFLDRFCARAQEWVEAIKRGTPPIARPT